MVKASELAGKQLISLSDAKAVGCILRLGFDSKLTRAKAAEIVNDEDDDFPEHAFVPLRYLKCEGDAAVIKSVSSLSLSAPADFVPFPIGAECFNQSGDKLGSLRDIELEKSAVVRLICEKQAFTPKELISRSDGMLIFNDTGAPLRVARKRVPRPTQAKEKRTAKILPASETNVQSVMTPTSPQSVTVTRTPGEPVKDYSFLLGKPVRTAVVSGGKVIIPAGTLVSEKTIEIARKHGKLVQLALHAY